MPRHHDWFRSPLAACRDAANRSLCRDALGSNHARLGEQTGSAGSPPSTSSNDKSKPSHTSGGDSNDPSDDDRGSGSSSDSGSAVATSSDSSADVSSQGNATHSSFHAVLNQFWLSQEDDEPDSGQSTTGQDKSSSATTGSFTAAVTQTGKTLNTLPFALSMPSPHNQASTDAASQTRAGVAQDASSQGTATSDANRVDPTSLLGIALAAPLSAPVNSRVTHSRLMQSLVTQSPLTRAGLTHAASAPSTSAPSKLTAYSTLTHSTLAQASVVYVATPPAQGTSSNQTALDSAIQQVATSDPQSTNGPAPAQGTTSDPPIAESSIPPPPPLTDSIPAVHSGDSALPARAHNNPLADSAVADVSAQTPPSVQIQLESVVPSTMGAQVLPQTSKSDAASRDAAAQSASTPDVTAVDPTLLFMAHAASHSTLAQSSPVYVAAASVQGTAAAQQSDDGSISIAPPPLTDSAPASGVHSGDLAFAARLTRKDTAQDSSAGDGASPDPAIQDSLPPVVSPAVRAQASSQTPERQEDTSAAASSTASQSGKSEAPSPAELFSKQDGVPWENSQQGQPQTTSPAKSEVSAAAPAAHTENWIEPPEAAPTSSHDITVHVPDATDRGTSVRFVDRGGEIHVSVRTGDTELAQTLRSGLSDFVERLDHTGLRAEVWRAGPEAAASQNDAQNHSQNEAKSNSQDNQGNQSGSGRNSSGSQGRDGERQNPNRPRWVEELETSIAIPTASANP